MRLLLELLFDTTAFAPYLLTSPQSLARKLHILLEYTRISLKLLLIRPIFALRRERFFGLTVSFFSYRLMHLLFRVIFVRSEYYFRSASRAPVILDCGANIGLATLFFKWLYPHSQIYAFEPDPATCALLQRNVSQNNLHNVTIYQAALSDRHGQLDFYVDHAQPGAVRMSLNPERMPRDKISVAAITLSSVINAQLAGRTIDYLKLDVEGAEEQVLSDLAEHTNMRKIRRMFIEYHHNVGSEPAKLARFLTLLEAQGFQYQVDTYFQRLHAADRFQNILIHAYQPDC